jgi:hypothetical protein
MEYRKNSFSASLDVVKLFTTLSTGALGFSIGLTAQTTNNYPGVFRIVIIVGWFIFFFAVVAGLWAQMSAVSLLKAGTEDPNDKTYRGFGAASVGAFLVGVALLGTVLLFTTPLGAPGERLAVASPPQAIARALLIVGSGPVSKIATTEYVKGVDPVRPEQASWHIAIEIESAQTAKAPKKPSTLDVYVDPVNGCTYVVQRTPHVVGNQRCRGF